MLPDAVNQPGKLRIRLEVLHHAKRSDHHVERRFQIVVGDVGALGDDPLRTQSRLLDLRAAQIEHRFGQVEAVKEPALPGERNRHPPGSAAELENACIRMRQPADVEGNVAQCVGVQIVVPSRLCAQIDGYVVSLLYPASAINGSRPQVLGPAMVA